MVLNGMVWYDVILYVLYDMVLNGVVWYGITRYGKDCYSLIYLKLIGMVMSWYVVVWCNRYSMV
jgi:hypothetical protein